MEIIEAKATEEAYDNINEARTNDQRFLLSTPMLAENE